MQPPLNADFQESLALAHLPPPPPPPPEPPSEPESEPSSGMSEVRSDDEDDQLLQLYQV